MRQSINIINIWFLAACAVLCGCVSSGDLSEQQGVAAAGWGKASFSLSTDSSLDATRSGSDGGDVGDVGDRFDLPAEYIPGAELMSLRIVGSYLDADDDMVEKEYDETFESVAAYNDLLPFIPAGAYCATASYLGEEEDGPLSGAHFSGCVDFVVVARRLDASFDLISKLDNSAFSLSVTDSFLGYFGGGATLTLSTDSGYRRTFIYPSDASVGLFFLDAGEDLYLEGTGTKQPTTESGRGEVVTFSREKIGTTAATTLSRITVDAEGVGSATITVTLDDAITIYTEGSLELNPLP